MADDLRIFPDKFVPNVQASDAYRRWAKSAPGDHARWEVFRDALLADPATAVVPVMATKFGKALSAAGEEHMSISALVGLPVPPYPPPDLPPVPPPQGGTRDAAYWPFTATSPWNYPIGSGATYTPCVSFQPGIGGYDAANGPVGLNAGNGYSIPIFISTLSDPLTDVYSYSGFIVNMRVPLNATPALGSDGHMCVIDETRSILLETYGGLTRTSGRITAPTVAPLNSPKDAGVYPGQGWHGTRAYGGSSIGGLIREHELINNSVPHALAMAVERKSWNGTTPNGAGYVWPASNADDGWNSYAPYGTYGNLHMGSLLAIPPSVNIEALGIPTARGLALAKAMQDYGVYGVDSGAASTGLIYYADPSSEYLWDGATRTGLSIASHQLQIVTNNTPSTPGGGGTPRRPLAPEFA